jgi:hypothetical protein
LYEAEENFVAQSNFARLVFLLKIIATANYQSIPAVSQYLQRRVRR